MAAEELRLASEANSEAHKAAKEIHVPSRNGPTIRSKAGWTALSESLRLDNKAAKERSVADTHMQLASAKTPGYDHVAQYNIAYARQSRSHAEHILRAIEHNHLCNLPLEKKGNM